MVVRSLIVVFPLSSLVPTTSSLADGVDVPMPTLPVKSALPATVSLLSGEVVPMPTLPPDCRLMIVGVLFPSVSRRP